MCTDDLRRRHSAEAEEAVLGAILVNDAAVPEIAGILQPSDFFLAPNRSIWCALAAMHSRGQAIDVLTVSEELQIRGELEQIGGDSRLAELVRRVPFSTHALTYAQILCDRRVTRELAKCASDTARIAGSSMAPPEKSLAIRKISARLLECSRASIRGGPISTWADQQAILPGIRFLWPPWLPIGMLSMIVGAPEVGKSALALGLVRTITGGGAWPDGTVHESLGPAVWLDTENAQAINHERAAKWGLLLDQVLVPTVDGDPLADVDLLTYEGWAAFEGAVRMPGVKLAVVDSLGGAFVRENESEVKLLLKRLSALARDAQVACSVIHHPRKAKLGDPNELSLERVRGHSGIVQFARVVWAVERPDPENPHRGRVRCIKSNLGAKPSPFGFEITEYGLAYGAPPEVSRNETQRDRASDLLLSQLKAGPQPASQLYRAAQLAGISDHTLRRAKENLGVVASKTSGPWIWGLPSRETGNASFSRV